MTRLLQGLFGLWMVAAAMAGQAVAVTPDEMLKDPVLEARAREISKGLRCVVCQNQSIDDSSAPLAQDLRVLVRKRLTAGDSNEQALNFIVARYGNFVLLKPPFQLDTLLLWLGPFLLLGLAVPVLLRTLKRQEAVPEAGVAPLNKEEQRRLAKLIDGGTAK